MDKSSILKAFNDHFVEFAEDISTVFPNNRDVATTKNALLTIRKANPKIIIYCWRKYVSIPYAKKIEDGDLTFFIEKDYQGDLRNISTKITIKTGENGNDAIMQKIDRLRGQVRNMCEEDQQKSMTYAQNLTKLANIYDSL